MGVVTIRSTLKFVNHSESIKSFKAGSRNFCLEVGRWDYGFVEQDDLVLKKTWKHTVTITLESLHLVENN